MPILGLFLDARQGRGGGLCIVKVRMEKSSFPEGQAGEGRRAWKAAMAAGQVAERSAIAQSRDSHASRAGTSGWGAGGRQQDAGRLCG